MKIYKINLGNTRRQISMVTALFPGMCASHPVLQKTCVFKKLFKMILMSGNSIEFGEEKKKLFQKMCSVRMLIWSAAIRYYESIK